MSAADRRDRLRELMYRSSLGAVLLQRPANFTWYTNGADNRVDHADPLGVAAILLTNDAEYVLTDNVEADRMGEEQTSGFEVVEYPWYEDPSETIEEIAGGVSLGADHPIDGVTDLSQEIAPLRYILDTDAIDRYRRVGADASAAVAEAVSSLEPDIDEHEAVANLVAACRRRGLFTAVGIAAGKERIPLYRHPIPRGGRLGGRAMLVLCAERGGLYANLTRIVHFEEPDEDLRKRQEVCDILLTKMREDCVPGRTLAEVFEECKKSYAEAGFPEEWRQHHQGGLTGYASREVIATHKAQLEIQPVMAFAWNPSLFGAKAEETFVLTESGPEIVSS